MEETQEKTLSIKECMDPENGEVRDMSVSEMIRQAFLPALKDILEDSSTEVSYDPDAYFDHLCQEMFYDEMRREEEEMSDFLCIGDYICLYCEDTEGYIFSWQSSSVHNGIYIFHRQERSRPEGIPNPHTVVFQVCIQNRYKLNKKYRKCQESLDNDPSNVELKALLSQTKAAAQAENEDNVAEQKRQQGKRVRYGEVIQLRHVFTGKYIHNSTTQTSRRDKNNMMIHHQNYNAKHAQFRILPRYKVKSEGEAVQIYDQIVFESIKSPGQYFHASVPFTVDYFHTGAELNLGVDQTGFTLVKYYKPDEEKENFVRGGSVLRLFHKELEAYLVAEGLFEEKITEDVHLRIRHVDQMIPKSLYPSSSGITYWQIEAESSILQGEVIRWEQQVRFRHMTTRYYLCMNSDLEIALTHDPKDPNTVFRLHPIIKETDEIQYESYARIEHVLSGFWLHALKDEEYKRKQLEQGGDDNSMTGLKWDGASLRKISASGERIYHDAYTIQRVEDVYLADFNFVAGMVPMMLNLIEDFDGRLRRFKSSSSSIASNPSIVDRATKADGRLLNGKKTHRICVALKELKDYMIVYGVPTKQRQKLMRNFMIIDLLVRLLRYPIESAPDRAYLAEVFKSSYALLQTYMIGNSRKNALYFAKYIDFFQTQFLVEGEVGLNVAQMIVELIRDNRKIVDRITKSQIDQFIELLRTNKNYRYLDLLNVLCVCDGVAIPDNQTYITQNWLRTDKVKWQLGGLEELCNPNPSRLPSGVFLTERGQNLNRTSNVIYISTDMGETWKPLHEFLDSTQRNYDAENVKFLEHQLDLFRKLCYGRNDLAIHVVTKEFNYLTWEEAFLCVSSDQLPDAIRARYCDLIIGMFVDVGNNYSVLDYYNLSFVYEDVDEATPLSSTALDMVLASSDTALEGAIVPVGDESPMIENCDKPPNFFMRSNSREEFTRDLVTIFPVLRDWITEFLSKNDGMVASDPGHNMLIEQVLRLLHYLVKFGYYGNTRDIQKLQEPLLNLLDGHNDVPFVLDQEATKKKGVSKETQKLMDQFKKSDRYEPGPETTAIVNAKYEALCVLELIFTYQFNARLQSFSGLFKGAEKNCGSKKHSSALEPLLWESYDALDQAKRSMRDQRKMIRVLRDMFERTSYFDSEMLVGVLLDLTNYKYDKLITKSLALLNKYFSSKMGMITCAVQAQVLITPESVKVHQEVQRHALALRRMRRAKINDSQVDEASAMFDTLTSFCHLPDEPDERHPMNQSILINHEVLSLVFDYLSQEIDVKLMRQYAGTRVIMSKAIGLLRALARGNDTVQKRIYSRLDSLLRVPLVEGEMALALREAFVGNQATCLKVTAKQLERLVAMVGEYQERVPELLDLLAAIVKVNGLDLALKRNQAYVMKFIMQSYSKTAHMFDLSREQREQILLGTEGEKSQRFLAGMIDLLATCAEGENQFIESLCQTILHMDEILWIVNHERISCGIKAPYVKYLHWVYMRGSASLVDSGASELTHDRDLWRFLEVLVNEANLVTEYLTSHTEEVSTMLKSQPPPSANSLDAELKEKVQAKLHFILDAALPFLRTFFSKFYSVDRYLFSDEPELTNTIAQSFLPLCNVVKNELHNPSHLKTIVASMTTILHSSTVSLNTVEDFIRDFGTVNWFTDRHDNARSRHLALYMDELELNSRFRTFAVNCSLLYGGHNTVAAQLKYTAKQAAQTQYTIIGSDEALLLGEEFQDHIKCFLSLTEKKVPRHYINAEKLIQQLGISSSHEASGETARIEQEELDIKCLQILRAMIHNEVVKLPTDWEDNPDKNRLQLARIADIQRLFVDKGAIVKVLPLLSRANDEIARETLAFISAMLFNANVEVQKAMIDYFKATREEVFFLAVRNRMQLSTIAIKERRALAAQKEAREKEVMVHTKSLQSTMSAGRRALQDIQNYETDLKRNKLRSSKRASLADLQFKASKFSALNKEQQQIERDKEIRRSRRRSKSSRGSKKSISNDDKHVHFRENGTSAVSLADGANLIDHVELNHITDTIPALMNGIKPDQAGTENKAFVDDTPKGTGDEVQYKDEGYIELVLKVLARMCDGQFNGLQEYLREQPDNMKTFNIVSETTSFLNMVYSSITPSSIDLVIQLFSTLNEFASGNQPNRASVLNGKVVDYINFILRAGEFSDCPPEKVLELRHVIGNLLFSLIEENGTEPLIVATEVKDTLDKEAIYRIMGQCFEMHQIEKPKWHEFFQRKHFKNIHGVLESAKSLAKEGGKYMKLKIDANQPGIRDKLMEVGFVYYFILARFYDIDPKLSPEDMNITPEQEKAFRFYKKNSASIEILKDDFLQKVHFRVKNKNVLREEVKEKLKWNVDRSSPSNKIRDLMMWSKDILKDIHYQRRILSNFFAAFLTKHWLLWNYIVMILSLAINILMLLTWDAKMSLEDVPENSTTLPDELFDPRPKLANPDLYYSLVYIMGGVHNFFSFLVLVSYFLSNHPEFPKIGSWIQQRCKKKKPEEEDDEEEADISKNFKSKLDVQFFSVKTFYYLLFMAMSVTGSFFHGYCFAFHLINIVNNNQLLAGVIQAVTQNGKSLLWVGVLGIVIFYLYAIIAFALFRDVFDPKEQLYCASLLQCTITMVRYGLVGDYDEMYRRHDLKNNFNSFLFFSIYQVSFFVFITTIGLNIIFGIIVDTFSELRDLKWTAESDMRDTCFICSRKSYDFEHHGLGFSNHVKNEHNMWAYIFFFIHLDDTKPNDYTALELYVHTLLQSDRYEFFPMNRALSLVTMGEDSTESKIDELLQYVLALVQKQKEEESEKKRQEERLQQKRWQEQHRHALRLNDAEAANDAEVTLRRFMEFRSSGRSDWTGQDIESTSL